MSTTPVDSALSDLDYHRETSALLADIESTIDHWLQDDVVDIDAQRSGGLLELTFPNNSKIILNTQPPLHEVWLAARGGGFHYRWKSGRWLDTRDGSDLMQALAFHASAQAGQTLAF